MANKDLSNYSKEDLINYIRKLERKRYGLVWEDKPEILAEECRTKLPIIAEDKSNKIITDKNQQTNIFIEGDNYHALWVLNYTHEKSIDLIYIDPPYNTGNKDFRFNDRWVDEEDNYRHSKWLSFMEKRLKLAKNLLKDTGCLFISIDDNEQAHLRILCDELFGEKNVETYIWNVRDETEGAMPKTAKYTVRKEHEYLIACFKNKTKIKFNKYEAYDYLNKEDWNNPDNDPRGNWMSGNISRGFNGNPGKNYYSITTPIGKKYTRNWSISEDRFNELYKDNRIYFSKGGSGVPRIKIFQNEPHSVIQSSIFSNVKSSTTGKNLIIDILGNCDFEHPKPIELIARIIEITTPSDAIILDYFAGTGTTGHAVLYKNILDNGKRKFILCTNDEKNICSEICYPRIKRVIEGYEKSDGNYIDGLGSNLKYFRTTFIPYVKTDTDKRELTARSTELLCVAEDTFNEIIFVRDQFSIFENNHKITAIIYDEDFIEGCKTEIKKLNKPTVIYVFSYDKEYNHEDFNDLCGEIEIKPIPEAILNVYRKMVRKLGRKRS